MNFTSSAETDVRVLRPSQKLQEGNLFWNMFTMIARGQEYIFKNARYESMS